MTVRELLDGLLPTRLDKRGWLDRDVRHNWPKLLYALYRARDWTVPDAGRPVVSDGAAAAADGRRYRHAAT